MNLTEELRDHIEQQAAPVQMAEAIARAEHLAPNPTPVRSWFRPGLVLALGAIALIAFAVSLFPRDGADNDVITEPQPTTTSLPAETTGVEESAPEPDPTPAVVAGPAEYRADGWRVTSGAIEQLPGPDPGFGRFNLYAAEETSIGMIVAGSEGVRELGGDVWTATLWIERPDGSVQVERLDLPFDDSRDDVFVPGTAAAAVAERDGVIVVGGVSTTAQVVPSITTRTDDGWVTNLLPVDDPNVGLTSVIAVDDGFRALGQSLPQWGAEPTGGVERTYLWASADGLQWDEVAAGLAPGELITSMLETPTGLVGVGHVERAAAAWWSGDGGQTWEVAPIETQGTEYVSSTIFRVELGNDGLLALSSNATASQDAAELGVWASADGRSWVEVSPPPRNDGFRSTSDLTFDGTSFLVHEIVAGPDPSVTIWRTQDGSTLEPVPVPPIPGEVWLTTVVDGSVRMITGGFPGAGGDEPPLQFWTYDG